MKDVNVLSATTLINETVVDGERKALGAIEEVLIHSRSGQIAYVLLSVEDPKGEEDTLVPIPWKALRFDPVDKHFQLAVEPSTLQRAGAFIAENGSLPTEESVINEIHVHYGYDPPYSSSESAQPPLPRPEEARH